jgi:hypothetical protein
MATATKIRKKELVPQPPIEVETVGYNLFLSQEEAQTLRKVLRHVGGSSKGPRGDIERISNALTGAGVACPDHPIEQITLSGRITPQNPSIYFTDKSAYVK